MGAGGGMGMGMGMGMCTGIRASSSGFGGSGAWFRDRGGARHRVTSTAAALHQLRRRPVAAACTSNPTFAHAGSVRKARFGRQPPRKTEIGDGKSEVGVHHKVGRFEVTVDDPVLV